MLFHKYGGANAGVTNFMSQFSMSIATKSNVKLANGNTGHDQGIGIILCKFTNFPMIYPLVTVYYCTGHPSNTISPRSLKCYVGFQKVTSETIEHCDFVDLQGISWIPT